MSEAPKVGQKMNVRGVLMTIVKVRDFGTVDVVDAKGNAFRVSGLPFLKAAK